MLSEIVSKMLKKYKRKIEKRSDDVIVRVWSLLRKKTVTLKKLTVAVKKAAQKQVTLSPKRISKRLKTVASYVDDLNSEED